ncbi:ornithine cyclodeaminase family protein [Paraburkholderia sp. MM5384-R2]|uniref:ornithine cyclodeaminase family protein n=1 Tax=Paraburkholderia sp. MM5384-R2 TaxID=2723097 RepID=UPI00160B0AF7|nr:ornithine cyclodeaminase family protein [Paraburkholderia sp. MM5384-R2]MBB5497604.1 ornithine cyclodeaminase/alanine dehydrogenase [Paraburkholderia sp. MM5384-R2]
MTTSHSPVFVSSDTARSVFIWKDAISALQAAYSQPVPPQSTPARSVAAVGKTWLRTLSAVPVGGRYYGAKVMGAAMGSTHPAVEYLIVLFDRETSRIAGLVDGALVTGFRTAATSAAALDRLAPRRPARLAVLGSGLEASMHVRAIASVRELTEIVVFSPTPEKRAAFAEAATRDLGVPARGVASGQEAVDGAGLVLCAARSHGELPILYGDWLAPEATIVSIGSTVPSQREIDPSVVEHSDVIVCDMLEEVLEETGDMLAAREAGIAFRDKSFSMVDLMSGKLEEQLRGAQRRMFKSVGGGLQDIVVAELILTRALEMGLATSLPIEFESKSI